MHIVSSISLILLLVANATSQPLTRYERKLISSGGSADKMRVTLVTNPDDLRILRSASIPVEKPNHRMWKLLAKRMIATVQHPDHRGVGIAAPQVGINRQLIVVQRHDKANKPFEVYFNPRILAYSDSLHTRAEGCLSIPEKRDSVQRPWAILLSYQLPDGTAKEEYIEGFTARIFQHEIDHLHGVLFTDRVTITNK